MKGRGRGRPVGAYLDRVAGRLDPAAAVLRPPRVPVFGATWARGMETGESAPEAISAAPENRSEAAPAPAALAPTTAAAAPTPSGPGPVSVAPQLQAISGQAVRPASPEEPPSLRLVERAASADPAAHRRAATVPAQLEPDLRRTGERPALRREREAAAMATTASPRAAAGPRMVALPAEEDGPRPQPTSPATRLMPVTAAPAAPAPARPHALTPPAAPGPAASARNGRGSRPALTIGRIEVSVARRAPDPPPAPSSARDVAAPLRAASSGPERLARGVSSAFGLNQS